MPQGTAPQMPIQQGWAAQDAGFTEGVLLLHPVSRARCWAHTAGEQTLFACG